MKKELAIRNYDPKDYEQVVALLSAEDMFYEPEYSRESLAAKNPESYLFLVAEIDGKIVGTMALLPFGKGAAILYGLTTEKNFRGQGIATKLLNEAKKNARERGIVKIGMYVDSENAELLSFYAKRGWDKRSEQTWRSLWANIEEENE